MSKHGKNYLKARSLKEDEKEYTIEEAVSLLKKAAYAKFDESVEVAIRLGVNPKYSDQMVRGTVVLPHGTGKTKKICVIASGETDYTKIDRRMVLSVVEASEIEIDDSDIYQESTSSSGHSLDEIINYYRQVFQRDLSYFEQFISRWKQHTFQ